MRREREKGREREIESTICTRKAERWRGLCNTRRASESAARQQNGQHVVNNGTRAAAAAAASGRDMYSERAAAPLSHGAAACRPHKPNRLKMSSLPLDMIPSTAPPASPVMPPSFCMRLAPAAGGG